MKEKYSRELNPGRRKNKLNFEELDSRKKENIENFLYRRFGYRMPPDWKLYGLTPQKPTKMKFLRIYAFTGRQIPPSLGLKVECISFAGNPALLARGGKQTGAKLMVEIR